MLIDCNFISFGKKIGQTVYFCISAIPSLADESKDFLFNLLEHIDSISSTPDFNVIKLNLETQQLSLLLYENFQTHHFPCLISSHSVDIHSKSITSSRSYNIANNPPILHRKELLLAPNHPDIPHFSALTQQLEEAGLFAEPRKIGFKKQWDKRLFNAGFKVVDHQLVRLDGSEIPYFDSQSIDRHKTALTRYAFSKPMQLLQKYDFIKEQYTFFDYGCGKGSDIEILRQNNIVAHGWDPYFCPDNALHQADIVNLGFVINVIENPDERVEALLNAYRLCDQLLAVAVMLGEQSPDRGRLFQDGVLTSRNTFQKYYSQNEFREFLRHVLDEEPVAVGPGVFFVFKNKDTEQSFLEQRYRHRSVNRLTNRIPKPTQAEKQKAFYKQHQAVLDALWHCWQDLGRPPIESEFSESDQIVEIFTTWKRGLNFLQRYHGDEALKLAFDARQDDLRVYFAMRLFEQKRIYRKLPEGLQRDVKAFFNTYKGAQAEGKKLLFSAGNPENIYAACQQAFADGYGYLDEEAALTLHTSLVSYLPPVLRIYIACATQLYGDIAAVDLVKIHSLTGKLSLMIYDDFDDQALPRMVERIKIRLFDQRLEFYSYGDEFTPPYLYLKCRFIDQDFPHYNKQVAFDKALLSLDSLDLSGYGMPADVFDDQLYKLRLEVDGFELKASKRLPNLGEPCGKYHRFRDFIECGETQAITGLANLPEQLESYNALARLAVNIIDPVMDYFGGIELTYGFCSRELAKQIPARIAPNLDQHASHELNTCGNPICKRSGAACDFIVPDESMLEVAQWIVENTSFDRLYFYGDDLPIHVSYGEEHNRSIVVMKVSANGRLYPVVVKREAFLLEGGSE